MCRSTNLQSEGDPRGIIVKVWDCCLKMSNFELDPLYYVHFYGGARGVVVIVVGNGHGDTSSNPDRD